MRASLALPISKVLIILSLALILVGSTADTARADATILIVNGDDPGEGFNDPTPWTPTGGNNATTLGQARFNAFQYAADIWGSLLNSNVTIRVMARMNPLTCEPTYAVLGSAGAAYVTRDFTGAPLDNTWYPPALANALAGFDTDGRDDINAQFNSSINGDPDCIGGASWYYGFDASPPANHFDFPTVVIHEIGHGLGFQTYMDVQTGIKAGGLDDMFLVHLEREGGSPADYPSMTNGQRASGNISDPHLRWSGGHVTYMIPGAGVSAGLNDNYIRMHAPNPVVVGSSVSHFSVDVSPNEAMEPAFTSPNHDPGLALFLMKDIGWELDESVSVEFEQVRAWPREASVEISWQYWADEAVDGFNVIRRRVDDTREELANVNGLISVTDRRFIDTRVEPGQSYQYSVVAVRAGGGEVRSPQVTVSVSTFGTELEPNRPNPFNPATELSYRLGSESRIALRIYDVTGRLVRTLVDEHQGPGSYNVMWNGRDSDGQTAPAGVYFSLLETDNVRQTRRMVLLK